MKLLTHISTSLLVSLWFVSNVDDLRLLTLLFIVIYIANHSLDIFGHKWINYKGKMIPARNKLHSFTGVTIWGLIFASPFLIKDPRLSMAVISSMWVHYIEDAVTEGGVFLSGKKRRLPIRISYDNKIANKLTILLFLALDIPILTNISSRPIPVVVYSFIVLLYSLFSFIYV